MAKKQQQQKRPAAASASSSAKAPSNKALAATPGAKGGKRQQQPPPPYLALLDAGDAVEAEGGVAAVEKALGALEALTEEPEAFVAPPPELAQVSFVCVGTRVVVWRRGGAPARRCESYSWVRLMDGLMCTAFHSMIQALTRVLKAVFDHARSTQPIKLGPLQELLVEVGGL